MSLLPTPVLPTQDTRWNECVASSLAPFRKACKEVARATIPHVHQFHPRVRTWGPLVRRCKSSAGEFGGRHGSGLLDLLERWQGRARRIRADPAAVWTIESGPCRSHLRHGAVLSEPPRESR